MRINTKYIEKIGNVKRVIYLRLACSGGPFFKSKMGEIYYATTIMIESN